jgi:iron complex outermembrane receptor protein
VIFFRPKYFVAAIALSTGFQGYAEEEVASLDTITVTPRLWQEDLRKVPVTTQTLDVDGSQLLKTLGDITKYTSNVTVEDSSVQKRIVIRGISSIDSGLQDPVGYFINEVALPFGASSAPRLFDISQFELTKGPQGTLYGRNTEAGVIRITTAEADWHGSAWSQLNSSMVDGVDGPRSGNEIILGGSNSFLGDEVAGTIALRYEVAEGPYLNEFDGAKDGGRTENKSISTGLEFSPEDDSLLTLKIVVDSSNDNRNQFRYDTGVNETKRFTNNTDISGWQNSDVGVYALKYQKQWQDVKLISITGYTDYKKEFEIDLDVSTLPWPATRQKVSDKTVSQEVRLSSQNPSSDLKWLLGLYGFSEKTEIDFSISPMANTSVRETDITQEGAAVFSQVEYGFTDSFKVALGGRLEQITQDGKQSYTSMAGNDKYDKKINESVFLPKISMSLSVNSEDFLYGSIAQGYLPGGYNSNSANSEDTLSFESEYTNASELGLKSQWLDRAVSTDFQLFYTQVEDKQIVDTLPGFVQKVNNAGEAILYGAEFSIEGEINSQWNASLSIGTQRTEATDYNPQLIVNMQPTQVDLSGNKLPYAADYSYAFGVLYNTNRLFSELRLGGSSQYYLDSKNTLEQPGYQLLDLEVGYQFDHVKISLWGKNITDEQVISRAVNTPVGVVVEDSYYRQIGISLAANW